jgi:hypothetical protein
MNRGLATTTGVLVAGALDVDGSRYKVVHGDEWKEFSAVDGENEHVQ